MDGGTALIASMGVDAPEAYTANLYEGSCDDVGDVVLSFGGYREHTETGTSISVFIDAPPESVADGHAIIVLDMEAEEHGIVGCGEFVAADEG